jgi:monoterpene epsilon-lactone hydrolase
VPSEQFEMVVKLLEERGDRTHLTLQERRALYEDGSKAAPPPDDLRFEDVDAGGVPAEWAIAPDATDERVVLYLHGGAYCVCSPRTHRRLTGELSRHTGAHVLVPDYALAPERPFPAAIEDAFAAYRWLLDRGTDPKDLAVAGDSAGAGLTIALLLTLRDASIPMPACAVAISPWADLEFTGESAITKAAVDPLIQVPVLKEEADLYLNGQDVRNPLASPIYAELHRLPPLFIHVGGREVLLDDATRLHEAAERDGVDVTIEIDEDMFHVWHVFATLMPEGDAGVRRVADFILKRWSA